MPDIRIPEERYWSFAVGVGCRQDARSARVPGEAAALPLNPFGLAFDAIIHAHALDGAMNHGALGVGAPWASRSSLYYFFEKACSIQVRALSSPAGVQPIPEKIMSEMPGEERDVLKGLASLVDAHEKTPCIRSTLLSRPGCRGLA